jgi:CubicO group peptidase (beta-lactamase class C family)
MLGRVTPPPHSQTDAIAETRAALSELVCSHQTPGISYTQLSAEALIFDEHHGQADAGTAGSVASDTLYMAYSVTKVLTAIAVLQLAERDALSLDAPLSRYFAEHPYGSAITIAMLLAHTAGVPNPPPIDWFYLEGDAIDRSTALQRVLRKHPRCTAEPGAKYAYLNLGYWLLEKVIEAASQQSYADCLHQHLFTPLGLGSREVTFTLPPAERLATGHIRRSSLLNLGLSMLAPARYWLNTRDGWSRLARVECWGLAYGGAYVTPRALATVLQDLLRTESTLLTPRFKAVLLAPSRTRDGKPLASTVAFVVGELHGVPYFGKQGGGLGFQSNLRMYPGLGIATAFCANATAITLGPIDAHSNELDAPLVRCLAAQQRS